MCIQSYYVQGLDRLNIKIQIQQPLDSVVEKAKVIVDGKSRRDKDKNKGFFTGLMWTVETPLLYCAAVSSIYPNKFSHFLKETGHHSNRVTDK